MLKRSSACPALRLRGSKHTASSWDPGPWAMDNLGEVPLLLGVLAHMMQEGIAVGRLGPNIVMP